jgi:hypothetical protein
LDACNEIELTNHSCRMGDVVKWVLEVKKYVLEMWIPNRRVCLYRRQPSIITIGGRKVDM